MEIFPRSAPVTPVATASPAPGRFARWFGEDGLSFGDLIDLVNPLQHIPIIDKLYREATGDTAAPAVRVAGGALFGGPLGAALSLGSVLLERSPEPSALATGTTPRAPSYADLDPGRGGWIVQAAHAGGLPSPVPVSGRENVPGAHQDPPALAAAHGARRGGWIVAQADANSPRPAVARLHERA